MKNGVDQQQQQQAAVLNMKNFGDAG